MATIKQLRERILYEAKNSHLQAELEAAAQKRELRKDYQEWLLQQEALNRNSNKRRFTKTRLMLAIEEEYGQEIEEILWVGGIDTISKRIRVSPATVTLWRNRLGIESWKKRGRGKKVYD